MYNPVLHIINNDIIMYKRYMVGTVCIIIIIIIGYNYDDDHTPTA